MSIQPIRLFGDPVLTTPASPVIDFDKELRTLVKDLTDTMLEAPGAGLAAPQIGVPLRVFVWDIDDALGHLINPTLDLSDEMQEGEEGCLSFPLLALRITRPEEIDVEYQDFNGVKRTAKYTGISARCFQHELDHMNGIVYTCVAKPLALKFGTERRKKMMKKLRLK